MANAPTLENIRERQDVLEKQIQAVRSMREPQTHGNVTQMVMPPPTDGERAVHRVEKVAYLLAGLLLGAVVIVLQQGSRMSAMNDNINTERLERKMFELWAYDEAKTMRTFTTTGVLKPMKPLPGKEERKDETNP